MAESTWLDVNGDANDGDNYSGGGGADGRPQATDDLHVLEGNKIITTNPTEFDAIDIADLRIDKGFAGQFGDETNPIAFGDMTGELYINAPNALSVHVDPNSVGNCIIVDGPAGPYGVHLEDGGYTDVWIFGGGKVRLGADVNIVDLHIIGGLGTNPNPHVRIDNGATITGDVDASAGTVECYAALPAAKRVKISGTCNWVQGDISGTGGAMAGTVFVERNANFRATVPSVTIAAIHVWGFADLASDPRPRTATAMTSYSGGVILAGRNLAFTTAVKAGGEILGIAATSILASADTA